MTANQSRLILPDSYTPSLGLAESIRVHPGVWAERKLGFENEKFHWEWYEAGMMLRRLAIVAPREHAKSEVFAVNMTAHKAIYEPGSWSHLFSATIDLGEELLDRTLQAIGIAEPWMLDGPRMSKKDVVLANWSRITVGSVGRSTRGLHPDRIVGDDILDDGRTGTNHQRRKMEVFWHGAVGPMAHPGTYRLQQWGDLKPAGSIRKLWHPATKIVIVGTPFHQLDLLMSMAENPIYKFLRYSAVFHEEQAVRGRAVEAA